MITVSTLEGVRLSWVIGHDINDTKRVSDVTSCLSRRKEKFALYISHRTWSAATKLANNTPQASHVRAIRADVGPKRSSGTVVLVHTRARHESTTTPLVYLELTLGRICLKEEDVRTRSQPAVALKRSNCRSGTAETLQSVLLDTSIIYASVHVSTCSECIIIQCISTSSTCNAICAWNLAAGHIIILHLSIVLAIRC